MNTKDMRLALREAGVHVPRSNEELKIAYAEYFKPSILSTVTESEETVVPVKLVSSNIYTYVGKGDEPPHRINFMGMQWFVRGEATEVKNIEVLEKVRNNDCFRKGKVNMDDFYKDDEHAKKMADLQRREDRLTDAAAKRAMS